MTKNLKSIFIREEIIKSIRAFFYEQNFHEVIVPVLNKRVPYEENSHPFRAGEYFLSTSPERGLKRIIAQGAGNCFAIAKSFRDLEGTGSQHMREFLMLEWYRQGASYIEIMEDVKKLIIALGFSQDRWETISLRDLFEMHVGMSLKDTVVNDELLFEVARKKGYSTQGTIWRGLWDQIFVNEIEPHISKGYVFITDYPARISPLCKQKREEPVLAERFELYINGVEIANGNTENTDTTSLRKIFSQSSLPVDEEFLKALDVMKAHTWSGCGLGIDRLAMLFSGAESICDVEQLWEV